MRFNLDEDPISVLINELHDCIQSTDVLVGMEDLLHLAKTGESRNREIPRYTKLTQDEYEYIYKHPLTKERLKCIGLKDEGIEVMKKLFRYQGLPEIKIIERFEKVI